MEPSVERICRSPPAPWSPRARRAVGRLGRDQVADYARRKGMALHEAERWLAPDPGYEAEG